MSNSKEHTDVFGWVYSYDRKDRVWRAFNTDDIEVNQFHKEELFFCMSKVESNDVETLKDLLLTRVPCLTMSERGKFITEERFS